MAQAIGIRVLIVDDHATVRHCLRSVLQAFPDIEVIGEATDGQEALLYVAKLRPTVVLMDINMTRMDGITTTRLIKAQYPAIAVVGLSVERKDYQLYAMRKVGASDIIVKDNAVSDLYVAIKRAVTEIHEPTLDNQVRPEKRPDIPLL